MMGDARGYMEVDNHGWWLSVGVLGIFFILRILLVMQGLCLTYVLYMYVCSGFFSVFLNFDAFF